MCDKLVTIKKRNCVIVWHIRLRNPRVFRCDRYCSITYKFY